MSENAPYRTIEQIDPRVMLRQEQTRLRASLSAYRAVESSSVSGAVDVSAFTNAEKFYKDKRDDIVPNSLTNWAERRGLDVDAEKIKDVERIFESDVEVAERYVEGVDRVVSNPDTGKSREKVVETVFLGGLINETVERIEAIDKKLNPEEHQVFQA